MPIYGIYVRFRIKCELNGTTSDWTRALFLRQCIIDAAKRNGSPVPKVIIRAEADITDLPVSF